MWADRREHTWLASGSGDDIQSLVIIGERPRVAPFDSQRLSQRFAQILEIVQRPEIRPWIFAAAIEHREQGNANDRNREQRSDYGAAGGDEGIQKRAPRHPSRR